MMATIPPHQTLNQAAILQVVSLYNDFVIQTYFVVGIKLSIGGHQHIFVILIQNGDLSETLQIAVFHINTLLSIDYMQSRFINTDSFIYFKVDLCHFLTQSENVRVNGVAPSGVSSFPGILIRTLVMPSKRCAVSRSHTV